MMTILGTRGTIKDVESFIQHLTEFSIQEHLIIQAFDARLIYGDDHVISAVTHAKRAFQQETNATNSLALEILLYAAGERQIQKAIKKMGVKNGRQEIALLLTDSLNQVDNQNVNEVVVRRLLNAFQLTIDRDVIKGNKETLKRFGITGEELSTVPEEKYGDLILEKIAMVDVIK